MSGDPTLSMSAMRTVTFDIEELEQYANVGGAQEVPDRALSISERSSTRSPTGSIRTIRSMTSTMGSHFSGTGSASTVYVPPLDELSDIQSLSGSSGLSQRPSLVSAHHTRATDGAAVSSQGYLYPGDPRVNAPSRSSSLWCTSSMTDLDEEFASALRRAHEGRPGLGFSRSLVGSLSASDGSPGRFCQEELIVGVGGVECAICRPLLCCTLPDTVDVELLLVVLLYAWADADGHNGHGDHHWHWNCDWDREQTLLHFSATLIRARATLRLRLLRALAFAFLANVGVRLLARQFDIELSDIGLRHLAVPDQLHYDRNP
ncbi:hypothetical protein LXA43DRAFT_1158999 [Ganoderma leucocontextum]|nr:hypothetical protein LXA43DRAFT_1158999 [Ganoderma leucocontextum]